MNLGDLNKTIIIQKRWTKADEFEANPIFDGGRVAYEESQPYSEIDENGFPIDDWYDFATVHCMVTNIHGKELVDNLDTMTTNSYKRMKFKYKRYLDVTLNPHVTYNYRILYRGSVWNITSIDDIKDQHNYMEILVTKIENEWEQ